MADAHYRDMRTELFPNQDIDADPIILSGKQQEALAGAIPFHHDARDQEPMTPVAPDEPSHDGPYASPMGKRKWHQEHDVMEAGAAFDTDILLNEPHYRKSLGDEPL